MSYSTLASKTHFRPVLRTKLGKKFRSMIFGRIEDKKIAFEVLTFTIVLTSPFFDFFKAEKEISRENATHKYLTNTSEIVLLQYELVFWCRYTLQIQCSM